MNHRHRLNHVKQILYKSNILSNYMIYGQQNESVARTYFIDNYNNTVRRAGLFIATKDGFLGKGSPVGKMNHSENII